MPSVTVSGAGVTAATTYSTNDSAPYANALAMVISGALHDRSLTPYSYTGGSVAPGPVSGASGAVIIATRSATTVAVPTTDGATIVTTAGSTSITGGAAGQTVIGGSGSLIFTDITPSGEAVTYIAAGDGANLITTSATKAGHYGINTGAGDDTVAVFGEAVVNTGTGRNTVSVSGGNSYIYSEGYDAIVGGTVVGAGGTDTVNIGSGQTTINPGTGNFFVYGTTVATNPLVVTAGSGSDTVSVGRGGGDITGGSAGNNILFGGAGGPSANTTILRGTASGDQLFSIGAGAVTAIAGAGDETISGAGGMPNGFPVNGSTADNTFIAGSGNDTLIAGGGNDTLAGGAGTAVMVAGTGADTFAFQFGNGGSDTITGFKSTDTLQLHGYGTGAIQTTMSDGSTLITLSDGTKITLSGVGSLQSQQVVWT